MRKLIGMAVMVLLAGPAGAMPILLVDGDGQLTGANGVDVGGMLWDVGFEDGSCIGLFGGCDDASDFDFQTEESANLASQALLDQAFVGDFDLSSELTLGCESETQCLVVTPYSLDGFPLAISMARNFSSGEGTDVVVLSNTEPFTDFSDSQFHTWALWTPSDAGIVPEPGTAVLLGMGLLGLATRRKH